MSDAGFDSAELQVWQTLRAPTGPGADAHRLWLTAGEFAAAQGHLRRALGCWRRALEVDARGEKTAVLHEGISTLSQVLLRQKTYFLHVHDDSIRAQWLVKPGAVAWVNPAKTELEALLLQHRETGSGEHHHVIDRARRCVARQQFEPELADVSLVLELTDAGLPEVARQFSAFQQWQYDAVLARQERVQRGLVWPPGA